MRYESVGRGFESLPSHQEKPRHIVPGLFFFCAIREDSNSTALRSRVSNQPSGLLLSARFPTGRNVYQQAALCPENRKKLLRVRPGEFEQQRRRPLLAAETGRSCWGSILIFQSPAKGLRKNQQMQLVRPHPKGGVSNSPVGCCSVRGSQPVGMSTNRLRSARKTVRSCCGCDPGGFGQGAINDNFRRSCLLRGCGGRSRGWVQGRADRPDTR